MRHGGGSRRWSKKGGRYDGGSSSILWIMMARNARRRARRTVGVPRFFTFYFYESIRFYPLGGGITRPAGIKWTVTTPIRDLTISCDEMYLHYTRTKRPPRRRKQQNQTSASNKKRHSYERANKISLVSWVTFWTSHFLRSSNSPTYIQFQRLHLHFRFLNSQNISFPWIPNVAENVFIFKSMCPQVIRHLILSDAVIGFPLWFSRIRTCEIWRDRGIYIYIFFFLFLFLLHRGRISSPDSIEAPTRCAPVLASPYPVFHASPAAESAA